MSSLYSPLHYTTRQVRNALERARRALEEHTYKHGMHVTGSCAARRARLRRDVNEALSELERRNLAGA